MSCAQYSYKNGFRNLPHQKVLVVPGGFVVGGSVVEGGGHVVGGGHVGVLVVGLQLLSPKIFFLSSLTVKRNKNFKI